MSRAAQLAAFGRFYLQQNKPLGQLEFRLGKAQPRCIPAVSALRAYVLESVFQSIISNPV